MAISLASCVVIPNVSKEPFEREVEQFELQVTIRQEVMEILGTPTASFREESEFLYAATDWKLFWAVAGASSYMPVVGGGTLNREYFLWLRFGESGVLEQLDYSEAPVGRGPHVKSIIAAALSKAEAQVEHFDEVLISEAKGW